MTTQFKKPLCSSIRCEIEFRAGEIQGICPGFGESTMVGMACTKAFFEAQERMVYHLLTSSGMTDASSTNGFAAGESEDFAKKNAIDELIERRALLLSWADLRPWALCKPIGFASRLVSFQISSKGWGVRIGFIPISAGGSLIVAEAKHPELGRGFDCVFCRQLSDTGKMHLKLMRSLMRQAIHLENISRTVPFELPVVGTPADHSRYYADPSKGKILDEMFCSAVSPALNLGDVEKIQTQTFRLSRELPVVVRAFHRGWSELKWGKQSISGKNQWPHPLA